MKNKSMKRLTINPKFITDEKGRRIEVVLDIKEFGSLIEELEDLYDVVEAEKIILSNSQKHSLEAVRKSILKKK